jgi:hypothetical protein
LDILLDRSKPPEISHQEHPMVKDMKLRPRKVSIEVGRLGNAQVTLNKSHRGGNRLNRDSHEKHKKARKDKSRPPFGQAFRHTL